MTAAEADNSRGAKKLSALPAAGAAGRADNLRRLAVVVVAELVERDGRAERRVAEPVVVVLVVAGHRECGGARLLGRVDVDVAVPRDAGTRRDQLADDHVLLQADERVALGRDGGVGEDARRLL